MSHILDIIIKATDQASATANKVSNSVKNMGTSTTQATQAGTQGWQQMSKAQQQSLINLSSQGPTTMNKFKGAVTRTALKVKSTWKNMSSEMKTAIGGALTGVGLVLTSFLKDSINTARESEKGWIAYKNSLQVVSGSHVTNMDSMKQAVVDLANTTGRSTNDVRTSMTSFMNKGLSYAESQKAVYAASGMAAAGLAQDTASASTMIVQALNGRGMALKKLGIDVKNYQDAVTGQIDTERLLADITAKTKGAQEEYANSAEGVANRLDNSIGALKTSLGSVALQVLEPLAEVLADVVGWFNTLPSPVKTVAAGAVMLGGAFAMIAGPLLSVIELLKLLGEAELFAGLCAEEGIIPALIGIEVAGAPLWAIVAAIIAIGVAVFEVGKYFGWWTDVSSMIDSIKAGVTRLWSAFTNNKDVQKVVKALGDAFNWVSAQVQPLIDWIVGLISPTQQAGEQFDIVRFIIDLLGMAFHFLVGFLTDVYDGFMFIIGCIGNTIMWFQQLYAKIQIGITIIRGFISSVINFFAELPVKVKEFLTTTLTNIIGGMTAWVNNGKAKARVFVNAIIGFIKTLPSKVWNYLKQVVSKIISAGASWLSSGKSSGKKIVTGVLNGLGNIADAVFGKFNGVKDAINRATGGAVSAAGNFGSRMLAKFKAVINSASPSDFYKIPYHDFNAIEGIINDARPGAVRAVGRFGKDMMNAYDGTGFSLDTDLSKNSNVKVQQTIKVDHDFSNLPQGVSAEEVVRIMNRTGGSDEFGKVLASNVGFQREDSVMKGRLSRRASRLGGA